MMGARGLSLTLRGERRRLRPHQAWALTPTDFNALDVSDGVREQIALRSYGCWLPDPDISTRIIVITSAMATDGWVRALDTVDVALSEE